MTDITSSARRIKRRRGHEDQRRHQRPFGATGIIVTYRHWPMSLKKQICRWSGKLIRAKLIWEKYICFHQL